MIRFIYPLLLVITILGRIQGQNLQFYRESLNFELDDSCFYVSGMYYLFNGSSKSIETPIIYPYVYSTDSIEGLIVYNCNTMQLIPTFKKAKSHWFKLQIGARDSVLLHIQYHHRHNNHQATYILMSTHVWGKAFEQADYTLRITNACKIRHLFMEPDSSWSENQYTYFYWRRNNFMPQSDFIVDFEKP